MALDAYEKAVLAQIEAGLHLENWRPGFDQLEQPSGPARRPARFAAIVGIAVAAAIAVFTLFALGSLAVTQGAAVAFWLVALMVLPAVTVSAYLMAAQREQRLDAARPSG